MSRPVILGILNVTPDSFSDGGRWVDPAAATAHALELVRQGADVIDIGGESTRPGAERVPAEQELARVLPIVRELAGSGIRLSIDTMNASTAGACAEAGAEFINDVSGGLADPDMYAVVAGSGVRYIAMHWREHSATMQAAPLYTEVVSEVRAELGERIAGAIAAGIEPARLIVDPGLGFSKTADHNWQLLAGLPELVGLGFPVLVGASRKGFLADFAAGGTAPAERDDATATISALSAQAGAWGVRVHNVAATRRALAVWDRWDEARA
ncbi:dihydropteroate synthase [Glaciihabitans tibetensis]|uniref:Dihydropteroate synthase n=1 Tax=Glaciihabitans tibetensis TaxID=1266600 RepID=A0A2T0VB58_9MICO|nr:dihydropteroate synthase [Glaciihabitans tibetensis]PRY67430.1 dihydropteroate synthase [Glaciihabitans tibetensis]